MAEEGWGLPRGYVGSQEEKGPMTGAVGRQGRGAGSPHGQRQLTRPQCRGIRQLPACRVDRGGGGWREAHGLPSPALQEAAFARAGLILRYLTQAARHPCQASRWASPPAWHSTAGTWHSSWPRKDHNFGSWRGKAHGGQQVPLAHDPPHHAAPAPSSHTETAFLFFGDFFF